jgi:mRNA-degrading endonuclease RelE of RelBE toxin-antitoxin system
MSYSVRIITLFEKELKRLAKKYPSIKADYSKLLEILKNEPTTGTPIGKNCYKVRMSISSKGKGKSAGARVITHFFIENSTVYLLSIYDKSDKETLSEKEIQTLISLID